MQDLHRYSLPVEVGSKLGDAGFHLFDGGWKVAADVWGGRDRLDALGCRRARDHAALLERLRPVVEGGENVGVQVDHGYPA